MVSDEHDLLHPHLDDDHEETYYEKRIIALCNLLMDKGVITSGELLEVLQENQALNPSIGAKVVARAWNDPDFKQRLLNDGKGALAEMGITLKRLDDIVTLENTPSVHHVVVCTLCSCYPIPLLGPPPEWYKSEVYRSRVVKEPRQVLEEFGVEVPAEVEVRVVDSTAEIRYLVLPVRPKGTEGMSEEELTELVTRDSMIGTGLISVPSAATAV
ncbi:MAG: nitrile hydratase subunit alpha [Dehalococcoidia bacterium]|nr:nitrile hydratase subunit alpha [Dehalococcoidia bacterium]